MNTTWFQKVLSVLLVITIIVPMTAFAAPEDDQTEQIIEAILAGEAVNLETGEIIEAALVDAPVPEAGEGYLDEETGLFIEDGISLEEVVDLPAEGEDLPAEGEDLPAEGEDLPAEGEDLPAEGEDLPAEGEDLPVEGEDLPVEGEDLPAEGEDLPVEGEDLPAEGEDLPVEGEDLPAEGEDLPAEGEDLPAEGEDLPAEGEDLPVEGEDLPAEGEDLPVEGEDLPVEEIILPELRIDPLMDAPVMPDGMAEFAVFVTGGDMEIAYQWQMLDEAAFYAENPEAVEGDERWESAWTDIESATEPVLTLENIDITDTAAWQQVVYRCAVQAGENVIYTNPAHLFPAMPEVSMDANAVAEADSDFTYNTVTDENGVTTATITGYNGTNMDVVIPSTIGGYAVTSVYNYAFNGKKITSVVIPEGVVSLEQYAFNNCDSLISVTMPSSLRTICKYAFYDCAVLETIVIPEGVTSVGGYVFYSCDKLANVTLPSTLKEIGTGMFEYCDSLVEITIPEGVESIGGYAFYSCDALTTVHFPETLKTIREDAFYDCDKLVSVSLPDALETIEQLAFQSCESLTTVEFGSGLKTIGYGVFNACYKLANVNGIPASIESIGEDAFRYCREMKMDLVLPETLTTLGEEAFNDTGITSVSIPASIGEILYGTFSSCDNLTSVVIASGITAIARYAFNNNDALTEIAIPDSVTSIGEYAFYDCDGLLSVDMGDGVKNIGADAFSSCAKLAQVDFSASLESIGNSAFNSCGALKTDIVLPETLTSMGTSAFRSSGITGVTVPGSLKTLSEYAFYDCNNLTKVTFTGGLESIGEYAFYDCEALESISFNSDLVSIARYAFARCDSLTKVVLPDSVTTLGNDAFYDCQKLVEVQLSASLTEIPNGLFNSCYALTNVVIQDSVTAIGSHAFYNCRALESIVIPSGVTEIRNNAFQYCYALADVTLPETLTTIGYEVFYNCDALESIVIPDSVTALGYEAFYDCDKLKSVQLSSGLTAIEYYTFYSCDALESIALPVGLTSIGRYAFSYCYALTSVELPDGLTEIAEYAFYYCEGLTEVSVPDSVTTLANDVFRNCESLTHAKLPEGLTKISGSLFRDCDALVSVDFPDSLTCIGTWVFYDCDALTSFVVPEGVTQIMEYAFAYCDGLTSVTLPEGLTAIDRYAFECCAKLEGINFPSTLETIEKYAFCNCDALKSVVIPDSVTILGDHVFYDCNALESVTIGAGVTTLWSGAFNNCPSLQTVTLPENLTTISEYAFYNCKAMQSITLPESVTGIGRSAFACCEALTSITIPGGVTAIANATFTSCAALATVTLPEGITQIGEEAFRNCAALASIDLPETLTSLGYMAFYSCDSLESIAIPDSVTALGSYVFAYCEALESVTIGTGITELKDNTFAYCYSLESVVIPDTVTKLGSYAFRDCDALKSIVIPDSVTVLGADLCYNCDALESVTIGAGVTSIPYGGFVNCDSLTSITIPENVTKIEGYAFDDCDALQSIAIPASVTDIGYYSFFDCDALETAVIEASITKLAYCTFEDCDSLKKVVLPETLTTIDYEVFEYCSSLEEINIPAGVTSIGNYAFSGCASLPTIVLPESLTKINYCTFSGCGSLAEIAIPANVTVINDNAFQNCTGLTAITLPEGLATIGYEAFYNCDSLKTVTIPASVTQMEGCVFYECDGLETAVIEAAITELPYCTFEDCDSLKKVVLPEKLTTIEDSAFEYCVSLEEISIPASVTTIEYDAFYECESLVSIELPEGLTTLEDSIFSGCTSLAEITIPENVTTIGSYAFSGCESLVSVGLPEGLTTLENGVFGSCTSLSEITIPEGVTAIGGYAFSGCESLVSVGLPEGLTTLEDGIFEGCTGLAEITIPESVTTIEDYAFSNCVSLTDITWPDGITYIGYQAFTGCDSLEHVILPADLKTLEGHAFAYCDNLKTLELPLDLTCFDASAVYSCPSMKEIFIPLAVEEIYEGYYSCLSGVTLVVYPGSYAEEYAMDHGIAYRYVGATGGELVLRFDGMSDWENYAGMYITITWNGGKAVRMTDEETEYRFSGFEEASNCALTITNSYGDVVYANDYISLNGEEVVLEINDMPALCVVDLTVINSEYQTLNNYLMVEWLDADGNTYATDARLAGVPSGKALTARIRLTERLARLYKAPADFSWTASTYNENAYITLEAFEKITLTGTVKVGDDPYASAAVTAVQMLNGKYQAASTALTDAQGAFTMEIYAGVDASVSAEAYGYKADPVNVSASESDIAMGGIGLELLDGAVAKITAYYTESVGPDATASARYLSGWGDLDFKVYNETTGKNVEYVRQTGELVMPEGVSAGDSLTITVSSLSGDFKPVSAQCTMDSELDAECEVRLVQYGSLDVAFAESGNTANRLMVFDANGNRAWIGAFERNFAYSDVLPDGEYTVVAMGSSAFFANPSRLSVLADAGLIENTDYVKETAKIAAGSITQVTFESVPALDESKLYYTDPENTTFYLSKNKMNVGAYFSVKAKTQFKPEFADRVSNVKWIIEIPENCVYYNNTLSVAGKISTNYTLEADRLTVPVTSVQDTLRLCLTSVDAGNAVVSGYLEFDLDGKTIRQPVGNGTVKIGLLEIEVPNRVNTKQIKVSGVARANAKVYLYDNDVLIGQTVVKPSGSWELEAELNKVYTYTTHQLYAKVVLEDGTTLRSETKEVLYQYMEEPIKVSKVTMSNYADQGEEVTVFDFLNPAQETVSFRYWPAYPTFTFVVEFAGEKLERVGNVRLNVLCSDGNVQVLKPVWNADIAGWVVSTAVFTSNSLPTSVQVEYDIDSDIILSREEQDELTIIWSEYEEDDNDELWVEFDFEGIDFTEETKASVVSFYNARADLQASLEELEEQVIAMGNVNISNDAFSASFGGTSISIRQISGALTEQELIDLGFTSLESTSGTDVYIKNGDAVNTYARSGEGYGHYYIYDQGKTWEVTNSSMNENVDTSSFIGNASLAANLAKDVSNASEMLAEKVPVLVDNLKLEMEAIEGGLIDLQYQLIQASGAGDTAKVAELQAEIDKNVANYKKLANELPKLESTVTKSKNILKKAGAAAKYIEPVAIGLSVAEFKSSCDMAKDRSKKFQETMQKVTANLEEHGEAYTIDELLELNAAGDEFSKANDELRELLLKYKNLKFSNMYVGMSSAAMGALLTVAGIAAGPAGWVLLGAGLAWTIFECNESSDQEAELQRAYAKWEQKRQYYLSLLKEKDDDDDDDDDGDDGNDDGYDDGYDDGNDDDGPFGPGYNDPYTGGDVTSILDPSGYVYEAVASNRLEGVKATCYEKYTAYDIYDEPYEVIEVWDAVPYEQINPQMTDKDGQYRWDVPEGKWQVKYEKAGYQTAYSEWLDVPPPQLDVNEGLISYAAPTVESVKATRNGVEVKFSKYMQVSRLTGDYITVSANGAALSGKIELLDEEANPLNANETFASKLRFVPDTAQAAGTEYRVTVSSDVLSYAGVRMKQSYAGSTTSVLEPESIEVSEKALVETGKSLTVAVKALPASVTKGMTVKVVSGTSLLFDVDKTEVVLDENGSGTITVTGKIPGESVIRFEMMDGEITAETRVSVLIAGQLDCKHENVEIMERWENITATNTGDTEKHHVKGDRVWYLQCADCGSQPEMTFGEVAYPWTEAFEQDDIHNLEDEVCTLCGYSYYVSSIKLPETISVGLKEKRTANAEILPKGAAEKVTYTIGSTKIATVDATGKITAKKTGTTKLTITSESGVTATCTVKVVKAPTSVKASPSKVTIGVGETVKISGTLSKGSASALSYKSAKTSVATVDANGSITGVAAGSAKVYVSAYNGKKGTCTVTVKPAPTDITITPAMTTMAVKQKSTFTVKLNSGSAGKYKVESLNPALLSVDEKGNMTALGEGYATIRAEAYNGVSHEVTIQILPEPTAINLDISEWTLGVGEKITIKPSVNAGSQSNYTYKSVKSSVASVSSGGVITAKKKGTAKITVKTHNDLEAVCTITVKSAPKSVKMSKTSLTLGVNEKATLTAKLSTGSVSKLTWSSSNKNVVQVDENGNLVAIGVGKATVTVKTFNKKSAKCTVTVKKAPESLNLASSRQIMSVGQSAKLTTTLSTGSAGAYSYSALPEGLVTIDGSTVKAVRDGKVTITATAYNGKNASVELDVKVAPDKVVLKETEIVLGVNETYTVKPAIANDSPADITYSSNKKSVATVSSSGMIAGKKAGTAYITVKAHAGESAQVKVVVKAAPKSVKLSKTSLTLGLNEKFTLAATITSKSASKLTWTTSNPNVVKVDENGNLVAVGVGKATVSVRTFNKKTAKCTVTVKNAPETLTITADKPVLSVGQSAKLTTTLNPGSAGSYSYTALPEGMVTISGNTVKAEKDGKVTITATAYNGKHTSIELDVKVAPDKVVLEQTEIVLKVKKTFTLKPTIANGSPADITYSSSKKTVATVSSGGKITAKKKGTAYITVTPHAGESVKVKVVVK